MSYNNRNPGWDKKAINEIAKECYGGLDAMFKEHEWDAEGKTFSQIAPTKVAKTYGTVEAFVIAHEFGKGGNLLLNPLAAIERDPPQVWLTSFYGFDPDKWGVLTFTREGDRRKFLQNSKPGALVVSYATKGSKHKHAGRLLGVEQITHVKGDSKEFIDPYAWKEKQSEDPDIWNYGVKAVRAWKIPLEHSPTIEEFANETYSVDVARTIGSRCKLLTSNEAKKLLKLPFQVVPVFGGFPADLVPIQTGGKAFKPTKAGPVSKQPFLTSESEGPKHLYILILKGEIEAFVDCEVGNQKIIKVGFSVSPEVRMQTFNSSLPGDRISWEIYHTTFGENYAPFASSFPALAGEQAMKDYLHENATSLGGEFFLADDIYIEKAWKKAVLVAKKCK